MIYKFEGKTKEEALNKAVEELDLKEDSFEVEVVEEKKGLNLFKKSNVVINVHVNDEEQVELKMEDIDSEDILDFAKTLLIKMGYRDADASIEALKNNKLLINIKCSDNSILIGKRGKNLDAIQTIVNIYGIKKNKNLRVIVDCENYRIRHEDYIVKNAFRKAKYVIKSNKSVLLEPLNPFERRLVHTSLNTFEGIETISEGEGLFKRIRIIPTPQVD